MSENASTGNVPEENLKQKLVMRVAFAGVLIALLLAALAFIDYLGQPGEEPSAAGPTYTEPVPVPRKEVSQPVRPADSAPVAETPPATPAPEGTAPIPQAPPAAPIADVPPKPTVSAQPELPPSDSRRQAAGRPSRMQTPAEGTASSQFAPEPERTAPAEPRTEARAPAPATAPVPAPAVAVPPAPPRLFSGYAVQAGVFSDAQRAEELRAKLMLNGIPSTMEARVQVGPFRTREEAESAREKLKALGVEGILLSPKGAKR